MIMKAAFTHRCASLHDHGNKEGGVSDSFKTPVSPDRTVSGMTPRFSVIELVTADMGQSLAFYRRLGLDIPADADDQPHVEAKLPGGMRMAWDTVETIRSFDPDYQQPGVSQISLAFDCDEPAQVDATYNDLVKAGYRGHHKPWDAFWGQRYATVLDPDGNGVDLFATLPSNPADVTPG